MAVLDIRSHAGTTGFAGRIATTFSRIAEAMARRSLYRQTVRELGSLTDRDLADLGIHRSMIQSVAADAVRGAQTRN